VPPEVLAGALREILDQFDAASSETQTIEGHWRQSGELYQDVLVRLFVDIPDIAPNRDWMRQFKERWRDRLEQIDLWVVSYAIEVE